MKYCEEYLALLSAFADDACTPEEAQRVREHLAVCPGCRAYWNEMLQIKAAFPDVDSVEVPEGLADGICAAVRAQPAVRHRRSAAAWAKILAPMAACLLIAVALGFPSAQRNVVSQRTDTDQQEKADPDGKGASVPTGDDASTQYQAEADLAEQTPGQELQAPATQQDAAGKSTFPENEVAVAPVTLNLGDEYAQSLTLEQQQLPSLPDDLRALLQSEKLKATEGTVRIYAVTAEEFGTIAALFPQAERTSNSAAADPNLCCIRVKTEESTQ